MPHPKGTIAVHVRQEKDGIVADVELPADLPGVFVWHGEEQTLHQGKQTIGIKQQGTRVGM